MEVETDPSQDMREKLCGESLMVVGCIQIDSLFPHDHCELFLTCVNDNTGMYHDIRRAFGNEIESISNWENSDIGTLSRRVRYCVTIDDGSSVRVDEEQHVTLGDMINGDWQYLKLTVISDTRSADVNSGNSGSVLGRLCWQLRFTLSNGTVTCTLLRGPDTASLADYICKFDTVQRAVVDYINTVANDESDVSCASVWLKLITPSTSERSDTEQEQVEGRHDARHDDNSKGASALVRESSLEENFRVILSEAMTNGAPGSHPDGQHPHTASYDREGRKEESDEEDASALRGATGGPAISIAPVQYTRSQEYAYFTTRLGVNFRLVGGTVRVGTVENTPPPPQSPQVEGGGMGGSVDDIETCTLLNTADLKSIRERAHIEDSDYAASLDIIGQYRAVANRDDGGGKEEWEDLHRGSSGGADTGAGPDGVRTSSVSMDGVGVGGGRPSTDGTSGTYAERFTREKLWSYGPDSVKPTYYINAAPQKAPTGSNIPPAPVATVATPSSHTLHRQGSSNPSHTPPSTATTTATAHAVPVVPHGSSLGNDPRSPSARTPITPVAVANAVLVGPISVSSVA